MRCAIPCSRFLGATLAVLLLAGCIERAESVESRRRDFDRSGLADVLLAQAPAELKGGGAQLADGIRFLGMQADPARPSPGDRVTVDLLWSATEGPQENWKVFVHLDPLQGQGTRINADHEPAGGRYPTQVWREGDVVRDRFRFTVPAGYPAGGLEVWTGFFQGDVRLEVENRGQVRTDGQDRILAGIIPLG